MADNIYIKVFVLALTVVCLGGVAGVLVDADHYLYYWVGIGHDGRWMHTPVLAGSIGLCACAGGLLVWKILRHK